jgi:hypothetical protein
MQKLLVPHIAQEKEVFSRIVSLILIGLPKLMYSILIANVIAVRGGCTHK